MYERSVGGLRVGGGHRYRNCGEHVRRVLCVSYVHGKGKWAVPKIENLWQVIIYSSI